MNTANAIHKAELLRCGCRVDTQTGARFITCLDHANIPVVDPLAKKGGMRPLCIRCASQRIMPAGINITCLDCGTLFDASDIAGYALSVDSKPRLCPHCGTVEYNVCSCTQRRESI